jgi:hypothetical protein
VTGIGILPNDIGSPDCAARMVRVVIKPGELGDGELNALISEKAAAVAASSRADEVARREAVLASIVDRILQHHLARECNLPDAETTARHTNTMREFTKWCSKHGVRGLPAKAETLVSYLLARALEEGLSTDAAKDIIAGVQFAHNVSGQYIDGSILKAALAFLEQIDADEAVAEAAAEIKLPSTNGGSHERH